MKRPEINNNKQNKYCNHVTHPKIRRKNTRDWQKGNLTYPEYPKH